MPDISLFGLGKPAEKLIEKVANAFGRHFDPRQTVRMAEAEAKAWHILQIHGAETDIEVLEIRRRAAARLVNEELTNQANIDSVTYQAVKLLKEDSRPEEIDDDWVRNAMDKVKMISDEGMQNWWARIVAGEANSPGSFSRRTVNLMADIDKRVADEFSNLCNFNWILDGKFFPLVYDHNDETYTQKGMNFNALVDLETLGLIRFDAYSGFKLEGLPRTIYLSYCNSHVELQFSNDSGNSLEIGSVIPTMAGFQLASLCEPSRIDGVFEFVLERWTEEGLSFSLDQRSTPSR